MIKITEQSTDGGTIKVLNNRGESILTVNLFIREGTDGKLAWGDVDVIVPDGAKTRVLSWVKGKDRLSSTLPEGTAIVAVEIKQESY